MAISKTMMAALRAISYLDAGVRLSYKAERILGKTKAKLYGGAPVFRAWDHAIACGDHDVPVRIFIPSGEERPGALVFFHGGGWVTGDIDSYNRVCAVMASETRRMVISVDYRLAPEYPFPAAPEDCLAAAREVLHGRIFGVRPELVTLIGDSAGGNLAAAVSLMLRDRGGFVPRRQILLYPSTYHDHGDTSPFESVRKCGEGFLLSSKRIRDFMDFYRSSPKDDDNPYFSPLAAKDLRNQPKTLVITAEYDPLRDEGEEYGRRLKQAGNDVRVHRIFDALHGFITLPPRFEHVKRAYALIREFLDEDEN